MVHIPREHAEGHLVSHLQSFSCKESFLVIFSSSKAVEIGLFICLDNVVIHLFFSVQQAEREPIVDIFFPPWKRGIPV